MVDELRIPIWNRTRKPLAIALSGLGRGLRGRDDGGNVQYKANQKCHCGSPILWIYPHRNLFLKKETKE
jgi:hypothetical protein